MKLNTFFDFCSGIGGGRLGLEEAGLISVGYSDTSKLSDTTYKLMHDIKNEINFGNLKNIKCETLPDFDLLIAGFPCQTFSVIGRQEGFSDDRGQIIFHLARIIKEKKPKAFILENVRGLVTHDNGKTLEIIMNLLSKCGYIVSYRVLSSIDHGVPQMRQRIYFVGIRNDLNLDVKKFAWPQKCERPHLNHYLIDNKPITDENYGRFKNYLKNSTNLGKNKPEDFLDEEYLIIDTRMSDLRLYRGRVPTLRSHRDGIFYIKNHSYCELTGYEALLLQGFKKNYADKVKDVVSNRHLLMQAGNAMTVNVIKELGLSLKHLFESEGDIIMAKNWMQFEDDCFNYLCNKYARSATFTCLGKSNSTKPDIHIKTLKSEFYIETKSAIAQSGQFVLLPQEEKFIFSSRNKSEENDITKIIIDYMNNYFDKFNNAGTKGEDLDINPTIFAQWIVNYYKTKGVKYVITKGNNYIIFPVENYDKYFAISAKYRIKKSGSSAPAKKDIEDVCNILKSEYNIVNVWFQNSKLFVSGSGLNKLKFETGNDTYYLVEKEKQAYEVRRLSNTYNMNVIFSIKLLREQDGDDLAQFEKEI